MSKVALISAALVSVGFGVHMAVQEAERLAPKLTPKAKVSKAKNEGGLSSDTNLEDRIFAYARSRNGNVWSLSSLAAALPGTNRNYISTILTGWVKNGTANRTGRGEYVLNRKKKS